MRRRLIYGRYTDSGNAALARWAAMRMPLVDHEIKDPFGPAECVGVEHDRRLVAVVAFHNWEPIPRVLQISAAASTPMWARPETLLELFAIPFHTIGARKVYTVIPSTSVRVIEFNRHLGFKEEGRLSEHYAPKLHAVILGLKRHRFESFTTKLLQGTHSGQKLIGAAAA